MSDDQKIPWKRIAVEAVAIVASILLAFSIDALWDNYQDRREEYELLVGLNDEFTRHVASIEESMRRVQRIIDSIGFLLNQGAVNVESLDSIEIIEQAVFHSGFTTPSDELTGGVRDTLFESGKLDLIRNDELRAALVKWSVNVNQLEHQRTTVSGFVMQILLPYLSSKGVPLAEIDLPNDLRLVDRQMRLENLSSRYMALVADQEFLNLLTVRNWWAFGTRLDYRNAVERAQEIVELTHKEIQIAK